MFEKFNRSGYATVFLHISVWAIILVLPMFLDRPELPKFQDSEIHQRIRTNNHFEWLSFFLNLSLIPLFYLNVYWLVPKFLNRQNLLLYLALAFSSFLAVVGVNYLIRNLVFGHIEIPFPFGFVLPLGIFFLVSSIAFGFIRQNFIREKLRKDKEAENLKAELSFLRSQLSPHFLFNTLNNLVSLARKKSDALETALIKLSGLMHYTLYESDDEKISVQKEIEYLDNYIELQKLRFGDELKISFDKQVPDGSVLEVVPMTLIPFVENAFKHGVVYIDEPEINVRLLVVGNQLKFSVSNKFNLDKKEVKDKSSGIGLINVKRRLDLLYSGSSENSYSLDIQKNGNWHVIDLILLIK